MGIYWTTTLYHGRLLSPAGFTRVHQSPVFDSSYISRVCPDRWILHAPKMRLVLAEMDPIIEDHEKRACRIQRSEVDRTLARHPKLGVEWNSSEPAELDKLKQLVELAAEDETAAAGTYICEVQWSTLSTGTDDSAVTYNLKVT